MTHSEAIQFLFGLRLFGARFGLETILKLAERAGNPQNQLRFIHVAGTNGKGSTCAMLESIYRKAGLRVGLFTSPHLVSFAERIQVNRSPISEADVVRLVQEIQPALKDFSAEQHPTFFEIVTLMALRYFAEQKCDLVIWETGLGGRLDATNIVTPLATVITNIGIDHSEWLGDTVEKIAHEKAGIIKPGVPVITSAKPEEGLEVVAAAAHEQHSPLTVVHARHANQPLLNTIELPLAGPHQRLNAAVALATVRVLSVQLPVTETAMRSGLATIHWPGRLQRVQVSPDRVVLLDGAHNAAGAEALRQALSAGLSKTKPTLILGIFRDKDSASMCRSLAPLAERIALTPVQSDRTLNPAELVAACQAANPRASVEICVNLAEALEKTAHDRFVVITGSLYLVGEAMELLQLAISPATDEKALNEWSTAKTK